MAHTVFLIGSNTLLWTGLRLAVRSMPEVRVAGDSVDDRTALARVAGAQPDAVLIERSAQEGRTQAIVEALRSACPASRLLVFASRFQPEELRDLSALGVGGFLVWDDLDLSTLRYSLDAVVDGGVVVASRTISRELVDGDLVVAAVSDRRVPLTERERQVLDGLAEGLTQQQIAAVTRTSLRTVKRTIAALGAKLDAPSPFVLGMKANALGLVPAAP